MHGTHQSSFIRNAAALTAITFLISGCLTGDEESTPKTQAETTPDHELSGSVGDGPVIGAAIRILRNDGAELMQFESDANAGYNITVRTDGEHYPLIIDARDGTDIVTNTAPDFHLLGAAFEPDDRSIANVNPFSTFAVELARDLPGGASKSNLQFAQETVSSVLNCGLASLKASGVMTTRVSGSNIAEMVRASEALGETVRRTRDALSASGYPTSGDDVVRALSSDLTDAAIDGAGGPRADARTAAVAVIVLAQVLLETMANELHVNGADATQLMRDAIEQVSLEAANPSLEGLTVTADMLARARIGIVAAHAITSDTAIADLLTDVAGIEAGSWFFAVRSPVLPGDYRRLLDSAILLAAGGSTSVVTRVNGISRDGTQTISGGGIENRAPTISGSPPDSAHVNSAYTFTPTASDPDDDTLTFSISSRPSWASFDTTTGELSGTPGAAAVHSGIVISVSDGEVLASLPAFSITVNDVTGNSPPTITGSPSMAVTVNQAYSFTPTASDPDNDTLTFSISDKPSWASFNTATGELWGTPGAAGVRTGIVISVSDGEFSASLPAFSITVNDVIVNAPPTISGSPETEVNVNQAYSFTPTASDPDNDTLAFSISGKPSWASFSTATGELWGTPGAAGVRTGIVISVSDGEFSASLPAFSITVNDVIVNSPPTISGSPETEVNVNQAYSFTPTASDPDNDTLTFSISGKPSWASFSTATGKLSGTPGAAGVRTGIIISVSDGEFSASLPAFSITVNDVIVNSPPTISGSPETEVNVNQAYSFTPTASDPDNDTLTFSISGKPSWASFSTATGKLSGTPGAAGVRTGIIISVSDGEFSASLPAFSITVNDVIVNAPPTISGSPATEVNSDQNYSFTPTANDPDNDTLTFSISGQPSWASFNNTTGEISGTPQSGDVGEYSNILITVSDGQASDILGPFTITVQAISFGSVTLYWLAPTQNLDGTPLIDLGGYKLYWGTAPGDYTNSVTIDNVSVTMYTVDNLSPGTYEFVATSFDTTGVESGYSAPATRVVQ